MRETKWTAGKDESVETESLDVIEQAILVVLEE
jgi:hypothetical protein